MNTYYNGTNHIFYSDNSDTVVIKAAEGQTLSIPGITTPPAASLQVSRYKHVNTQTITSTDTKVLFGTTVESGITGLTPSSDGSGTRFTASSAMKVLITYSIAVSGTNTVGAYILVGTTGVYYAKTYTTGAVSPMINGSCILSLDAGSYFTLFASCIGTGYISTDGSVATDIEMCKLA